MPLYTSTTDVGGLLPHDYGAPKIQPTLDASVFASVNTVVRTDATEYHVPLVADDAAAQWVSEGSEVPPSDPVLEELVVTPKKLAGLTVVSNELADDSNPSAVQVIGDSLPATSPAGLTRLPSPACRHRHRAEHAERRADRRQRVVRQPRLGQPRRIRRPKQSAPRSPRSSRTPRPR